MTPIAKDCPNKPLELRRSTHIYCSKCKTAAEDYSQQRCTWCGIEKANWLSSSFIFSNQLKETPFTQVTRVK